MITSNPPPPPPPQKDIWIDLGDTKTPKEHIWDTEYKKGKWERLGHSPIERSRSALLGNFYQVYCGKNNGTILDVGCGEGVLADFLNEQQKSRYTGIDISKEAIKQAQMKRGSTGSSFNVSSIESFQSDKKWNMIVFNEVLYYTKHKQVIAQFIPMLQKDGIIAVSSWYRENHDVTTLMTTTIFEDVSSVMDLVDQVEIKGWSKHSLKNKMKSRGELVWRIGIFKVRQGSALKN